MLIDHEKILTAYRKLKQLVYYDKTDLTFRRRLAEFECDNAFMKRLAKVESILNSENPIEHKAFQGWLRAIRYRVIPKQINGVPTKNKSDQVGGKFITNVTSAKEFDVTKVNYFFDGPIELHLISVLWIMHEGRLLDAQLGPECNGSRLISQIHNEEDRSSGLFKKYHEQYARWRDTGIRKARQMLSEERTSVAILGLDIQEYFYCIQLDYKKLGEAISKARRGRDEEEASEDPISNNLRNCLQAINSSYRDTIGTRLKRTHPHLTDLDSGLPIGLSSSLVLANWYLKEFDDAVKSKVRPAYYGRYVDDILLVLPSHQDPSKGTDDPVDSFISSVLVHNDIVGRAVEQRYEILKPGSLYLQQEKCILQFFDAKHSISGLEKFQQKLEENGSDFLLMPVEEADSSLEDVAYELLYEGSVNKFRSIKGMAENRYELAKHLAKQTILHLLTDDPPDPKVSAGLLRFFKGKSAIQFHDLWERVFTLFMIAGDEKAAASFEKNLRLEIRKVKCKPDPTASKELVDELLNHLDLSRAMALSLGRYNALSSESKIGFVAKAFRQANLMRHHFIRKPLLNYTDFDGALILRTIERRVSIDKQTLSLSPRYVNFDECLLLAESGDVKRDDRSAFEWAKLIYEEVNRHALVGIQWETIEQAREM